MKNKNNIEILIVDDEASSRGVLHKLLNTIIKLPITIKEANSVEACLQILKTKKIDLLFLDVQMPEQNGFDLLKQLDIIDFEIIFITGYDKYAVQAFRFNALDYLLKPVEIDELTEATHKAIVRITEKKNSSEKIANLLPSLNEFAVHKKIAVHINDKVAFIEIATISHINASDNYSEIVTCDKHKYTTPRTLKDFEVYLQQIPFFVRINRAVMINTNCILSYSKDFPCIVELKNGFSFEISRRKKADVLKILELL